MEDPTGRDTEVGGPGPSPPGPPPTSAPMSTRSFLLPPDLAAYYASIACEQPPALQKLAASSDRLTDARMRSSPEAGRLLALLASLMGARHAFEVGVFTGYGTAWLAGAVPPGGEVVALDVTDAPAARQWSTTGRRCSQTPVSAKRFWMSRNRQTVLLRRYSELPSR